VRRNIAIPGERSLTLREILMREPLPLSEIQDAVVHFLKGRADAVLFGAQAVNVYVNETRMSEDVDVLSTDAKALAAELRDHLLGQPIEQGPHLCLCRLHMPTPPLRGSAFVASRSSVPEVLPAGH
jgi:hypothetical protein